MTDSTPAEDPNDWEAIRDAARRGAERTGDIQGAEDAAQDAVLGLYKADPSTPVSRELATTVGKRRAIEAIRKRIREEAKADLFAAQPVRPVASAEDVALERLRARAVLDTGRAILTPVEYELLVTLAIEGATVLESAKLVAELSGMNVETLRTHLRRAVKKLRREMGEA